MSRIKLSRHSPSISHLLFADDCYIFSRVVPKEIEEIQGCLQKFSEALGQTSNHEKFEINFSHNTPHQFWSVASGILKITSLISWQLLRPPLFYCRNKISIFSYIEERARLCI